MIDIKQTGLAFSERESIQAYCTDFFGQHGLHYFQYLRCYKNGRFGLLTNNTGLLEEVLNVENSPAIFSSYTQENHGQQNYWFSWDDCLPQEPVQLARDKCQIYHGMTYVKRYHDYYDMIALGLPTPCASPMSYYLSKYKSIDQFIYRFEQEQNALIDAMDKSAIFLPPQYRDKNYQTLCLASPKIVVQGLYGKTHITPQEHACLTLLSYGYRYKEISNALNISVRTVETYISRMKFQTGIYNKQTLFELL